jgi:hypothetical protein
MGDERPHGSYEQDRTAKITTWQTPYHVATVAILSNKQTLDLGKNRVISQIMG